MKRHLVDKIMRLNNYINESREIDIDLVNKIKNECKYYFENARFLKKIYPLYRGIKKKFIWDIITPRTNRKPLDTDIKIHNLLDKEFKKQFGWKVRSQGVFCTGGWPNRRYGNVYYIFPVGKFEFVWSPDIRDLTGSLVNAGILNTKYKLDPDISEDTVNEVIFSMVSTYEDTNFLEALRSENEISIKCKRYYALSTDIVDKMPDIYEALFRVYDE